jgi:hypothetical protein
MECKICSKEISITHMNRHLQKEHNVNSQKYFDLYLIEDGSNKCEICGKHSKFLSLTKGYQRTCSRKCSNVLKKGQRTEEEKFSKRVSYLQSLSVDMANLSKEEIVTLSKFLWGLEVKTKTKKRIESTKKTCNGKGSGFGSKESIRKQRISILLAKGYSKDFLNAQSDEKLKNLYSDEVSKKLKSKKNKLIRIKNTFNISEEVLEGYTDEKINELFKECHIEALKIKGKNVIEKYELGNIKDFSEEDLLKLSGYEKKKNARKRTKKERKNDIRKWKITHLVNYYSISLDTYNNCTNEEIDNLYRIYLHNSGRLDKMAKNGRGGKWKKGWVHLKRLNEKIFYRSSYELDFLLLCDLNNDIRYIEHNLFGIGYIQNNENHWYFPDFIIHYKNKKYMIEIKAKWQLNEENTKNKTSAGKDYCLNNNLKYIILTEDQLYNQEVNLWQQFQ